MSTTHALMTPGQVARRLGIGRQSVHKAIARGALAATPTSVPGQPMPVYLIDAAAVDAYALRRAGQTPRGPRPRQATVA